MFIKEGKALILPISTRRSECLKPLFFGTKRTKYAAEPLQSRCWFDALRRNLKSRHSAATEPRTGGLALKASQTPACRLQRAAIEPPQSRVWALANWPRQESQSTHSNPSLMRPSDPLLRDPAGCYRLKCSAENGQWVKVCLLVDAGQGARTGLNWYGVTQ